MNLVLQSTVLRVLARPWICQTGLQHTRNDSEVPSKLLLVVCLCIVSYSVYCVAIFLKCVWFLVCVFFKVSHDLLTSKMPVTIMGIGREGGCLHIIKILPGYSTSLHSALLTETHGMSGDASGLEAK